MTLLISSTAAFGQAVPTGSISGTVSDPSGSLVPNATVVIKSNATNAEYTVQTSDNGTFTVPSLATGLYTATITAQNFKQTLVRNIKVDVAQTTNVNVELELGQLSETVTVESGGEVLQTTNTDISSRITGRQIIELPFATRDAMQLVLVQPGTQTAGTPRSSSFNGLPKGSLNITLDGINVQDNLLKSSDGFFTGTQLKADAISELTTSSATPGAESAAGGAAVIRGTTRAGTNDFHGGGFWQHRNTALNANYYFNNLDGLPRDRLLLNQFGGNIGGPIWRNRAFFFFNYEEFRLPQTYGASRVLITDLAASGVYTYRDTTGVVRNINLLTLAGNQNPSLPATVRPYPTTLDPIVANLQNLFSQGARGGTIRDRIASASDYIRRDLTFQAPGTNIRRFPTARFDWNITKNNQLEFVYHYQQYFSDPDAVNGQLPVVPGEGIVLGAPEPVTGSIIRNAYSGAIAWRSTISSNLTNEIRGTLGNGGISIFGSEAAPGLFAGRRGYSLVWPSNWSNPQTRSSQSRRHTPIWILYDNATWIKGEHSFNFGGSFTLIKSFQSSIGTQAIPSVTFGIAAGDPVNTGATSIFTTTNFPNSSAAQRSDAAALYALVTGRISSMGASASLDPDSKQYARGAFIEQNRQKELGFYIQDSWRFRPNLTINYGARWELDFAPRNVNGIYTTAGYESIYGVSGVGNVFKPGLFANNTIPQFRLVDENDKPYKTRYNDIAPSFGIAWTPHFGFKNGLLRRVVGRDGETVLRGGYSIAFVREGMNTFNLMWGSNQGGTVSLSVSPGTTPNDFVGPAPFNTATSVRPGSVHFRDATLPSRAIPTGSFPITAGPGASFNEWDPNLRMGYVQSWSAGVQRELTKNMALEIRWVGNHGTNLWRQLEINEVNIFENGFLDEFKRAQRNLLIARGVNPASNNFGNQGLPGQQNIQIISTALGTTNDAGFATTIQRGLAGTLANNIAFNATRMNNLINANLIPFVTLTNGTKVSNYFIANPLATGGAYLVTNSGHTTYNSLQIELRRRFSRGLLIDGSYTFGKSLTNMFNSSSAVFIQPTTLRDSNYDKGPSPFDIRQAFKINGIYELPVGPGRRWLNTKMPVVGKLLEGWQIGGVARIQSGTVLRLTGGRFTFNQNINTLDNGVILHNITTSQLQSMVQIRQTPGGIVYWLPQSIIDNTLAAFETGGKTLANLNPSAPYIGPPTTPGELGARIYLYGPWQKRIDLNILKRTRITERVSFDFRVQFLNAFNYANFFIGGLDSVNSPILGGGGIGAQFGQTRSAYRDITVSGTNDPGGRLIEFQGRFNF
ncbi:MAG TPA: carboxypeptidase regulatory-like domain-containing protein [Pyrinomonadaceae bacterium]